MTTNYPIGHVSNSSNNSSINLNFTPVPGTLSQPSHDAPDSPQQEGVPHKSKSKTKAMTDVNELELDSSSSGEHGPMDTTPDNSTLAAKPPSPPASLGEQRTFTQLQHQLNLDSAAVDKREDAATAREKKLDFRDKEQNNRTHLMDVRSNALDIRDGQLSTRESDLKTRALQLDTREAKLDARDTNQANRETQQNAREARQNTRDAKQNTRETEQDKRETQQNAMTDGLNLREHEQDEREKAIKDKESKRESKLDAPVLPPASSFIADPFNGVYPNMNLRFTLPLSPYSVANAADAKSADQANKLTSFLDTVQSVATTIDAMQLSDVPRLKDPNFILPERPVPNSGSQHERQARSNFSGFLDDAITMKTVAERMRTNIKLASQARLSGELSRKHSESVFAAVSKLKTSRKLALLQARDSRAEIMTQARAA